MLSRKLLKLRSEGYATKIKTRLQLDTCSQKSKSQQLKAELCKRQSNIYCRTGVYGELESMNTEQKIAPRRRTRAQIQQLVSEFLSSGMKQGECCRGRGLSWDTLNRNLRVH